MATPLRLTLACCLLAIGTAFGGEATTAQNSKMLVSLSGYGAAIIQNGKVIEKIKTLGGGRDGWVLPDGSRLIQGEKALVKYDPAGKEVFVFKAQRGENFASHACQPLPGGHTLAVDSTLPSIVELDPQGKVIKRIIVPGVAAKNGHMGHRGVRKRKNGEYVYVACADNKVVILNADGTLKNTIDLRKIPKPNTSSNKPHGLALLPNGNFLVGTGFGGCIIEFNDKGEIQWSLNGSEIPEVGLKYVAGMHVLPSGNIVVSGYSSRFPIFEVTRDKKVVWKLTVTDDKGKKLTPNHVQVLSDKRDPANFEVNR